MKVKRSPLILFLLILAGALLGSALWSLLTPILPDALARSFTIGATNGPWEIHLLFMTLVFGITLSINIGSLVGIILALIIFYRL